ncbi:MAG: ribonuclease [Sphingomonadales bacterium]|nr:ribonuclease [Sphingomonadales bacterium]
MPKSRPLRKVAKTPRQQYKPKVGHTDWKIGQAKKMHMRQEDLSKDQSITFVCGLDESGTGSVAGPMSVGCVVLPVNSVLNVKDSKKYTTDKARDKAYDLVSSSVEFGMVEMASAADIDRYGMAPAKDYITFKLLERMVELYHKDDTIIIMDGSYLPKRLPDFLKGYRVVAVPKADVHITAVSAASILAKVEKDRFLLNLVANNPSLQIYGLHENRGYLTPQHTAALKKHGPGPIHRLSINAVKKYVKDE